MKRHWPKLFLFACLGVVVYLAFRQGGPLNYLISNSDNPNAISNPQILDHVPVIQSYTGNAPRQ